MNQVKFPLLAIVLPVGLCPGGIAVCKLSAGDDGWLCSTINCFALELICSACYSKRVMPTGKTHPFVSSFLMVKVGPTRYHLTMWIGSKFLGLSCI